MNGSRFDLDTQLLNIRTTKKKKNSQRESTGLKATGEAFDPSKYTSTFFEIDTAPDDFFNPKCKGCKCQDNLSREFKLTPKVLLLKAPTDKSIYLDYYSSVIGVTDEAVAESLFVEPTDLGGDTGNCAASGLDNFWRSAINVQFLNESRLSVSQACPIRNCTFNGLILCTGLGFGPDFDFQCCGGAAELTSGGFMADCVINDEMNYCSQQQFCTQNTTFNGQVLGGAWSLVFYDCENSPLDQEYSAGEVTDGTLYDDTPQPAILNVYSSEAPIPPENRFQTPPLLIYEKDPEQPEIYTYMLKVGKEKSKEYLNYSATPDSNPVILDKSFFDNAGEYIILPAGIYELHEAVEVSSNLIGIGLPIIRFFKDAKMDFVKDQGCCSSIIFDNYASQSNDENDSIDYFLKVTGKNVSLFDIFMRNGGPVYTAIIKNAMLIISGESAFLNNIWLWNADHNIDGNPPSDPVDLTNYNYQCPTGLRVEKEAINVTAICLASEHMLEDNVVWDGDKGVCVFFQNEFPYYVTDDNFSHSAMDCSQSDLFKGYGMGSYCYFRDSPVQALQAFNMKSNSILRKAFTRWLNGNERSSIQNIITIDNIGDGMGVYSDVPGPLFTDH